MPTYVSKGGKWYPAKEKIGLTNHSSKPFTYKGQVINPGEPFIYDGPDREALKALHEAGGEDNPVEFLGQDFRRNPEFLQAVRNQGFEAGEKGVKDYLSHIGYDEERELKNFNEKVSTVLAHEVPKLAKEIEVMSGGRDTSGMGNSLKGAWDNPKGL